MYSGSNLYLFIYHFLNRHAGGVGDQVSATWGLLCIDCIPIYTPLVMHNISTAELQMVCWWRRQWHDDVGVDFYVGLEFWTFS